MLYTKTVKDTTLELLKSLMKDETALMPLKGLVYFADIDKTAPVKMADGKPLKWNMIEKRLLAMEKNTGKVFEAYPY